MQVVNYTTFIEGLWINSTVTVRQRTILTTEHSTLPPVTRDDLRDKIWTHRHFTQALLTASTTVMVPIKELVSLSELHACLCGRGTRLIYRMLILPIPVEIATQPVDFAPVVWVQRNKNSGVPIEDYIQAKVGCQLNFAFLVRDLDLTP